MTSLIQINDVGLLKSVCEEKMPFFLAIVSPECVLCKEAGVRFEEAALNFNSKIKSFSLNVNESALWKKLLIRAVPATLYFKQGCVLARQEGIPESSDIEQLIQRVLGNKFDYRIEVFNQLKHALYAEESIHKFYAYISEETRNGKIRSLFQKCSGESSGHHKQLEHIFALLGGGISSCDSNRSSSDAAEPESFSLLGALKTALVLEERAVNFYQSMVKAIPDEDRQIRDTLKQILKDENIHMGLLKKEARYIKQKAFDESMSVNVSRKTINDLFI